MEPQLNSLNPDTRRDLLVRAAAKLFSNKGFDGTTVKEIADAAKVNVSLVSYYFGGKLGLFEFCLRSFGEGKIAVFERLLTSPQSKEDFRAKLRILVEHMIDTHLAEPDRMNLIYRELRTGMQISRNIFEQVFLRGLLTLKRFFSEAQEKKILRSDLEVAVATQIFWVSVMVFLRDDSINLALHGQTVADPVYREKLVDHLFKIHLGGLLP